MSESHLSLLKSIKEFASKQDKSTLSSKKLKQFKKLEMSIEQAEKFYSLHKDKPFFNDLVTRVVENLEEYLIEKIPPLAEMSMKMYDQKLMPVSEEYQPLFEISQRLEFIIPDGDDQKKILDSFTKDVLMQLNEKNAKFQIKISSNSPLDVLLQAVQTFDVVDLVVNQGVNFLVYTVGIPFIWKFRKSLKFKRLSKNEAFGLAYHYHIKKKRTFQSAETRESNKDFFIKITDNKEIQYEYQVTEDRECLEISKS